MAENENNNAMLEALDSIKTVNVGDVVKGRVLQIDDDRQAIVGIEDSGVEGVVPANQLSTKPGWTTSMMLSRLVTNLTWLLSPRSGATRKMVLTCFLIGA